MMLTKPHPEVYWTALRESRRFLNWWMTRQYVEMAGLVWIVRENRVGWVDPDDPDVWFLPPLGPTGIDLNQNIFAGFPGEPGPCGTYLDHQYIYQASSFLDLTGSQWKVYRKNVQKYPRRFAPPQNGTPRLIYRELVYREKEEEVSSLLESWATERTLEDPSTFIHFVLYGHWRWGLFLDGALVGVNVGDLNSSGTIYRYCIDDGTPYLNEYLRHQFFISSWTQKRAWVNDGGDLGNPGLARFKWKLNPIRVSNVYSHIHSPEGD